MRPPSKVISQFVLLCVGIALFALVSGCAWLPSSDDCCEHKEPDTLQKAATAGNQALVEAFLAKGSALDSKDSLGRQAIHGAA